MDKRHEYSQQIDKAAKILDLRGDAPAAIKILEGILSDSEIQYYPSFELEALVFLAGIHSEAGKIEEARRYVQRVDRLDLGRIVGEEIRACLYRLKRIKKELMAS
jgi:hypothetical protein